MIMKDRYRINKSSSNKSSSNNSSSNKNSSNKSSSNKNSRLSNNSSRWNRLLMIKSRLLMILVVNVMHCRVRWMIKVSSISSSNRNIEINVSSMMISSSSIRIE